MTGVKVNIVKDIDPDFFKDLKKRLGNNKRVAKIGVPIGPTEAEGTPLALIAAVHEFGSEDKGIPERPWLRTSIRENSDKRRKLNKATLVKIVKGTLTIDQALGQLGLIASADAQKKVRTGPFAPLAQSTIKAKGSSKPLIDTGNFIQNIISEVGNADA